MKKPVGRRLSAAERAWLGLGLYILAADTMLWRTQNDTMSIQFGKWITCRPGKPLCLLGTAGIIAHLWWGLPLPMQEKAKRYLGGVKDVVQEVMPIIPDP